MVKDIDSILVSIKKFVNIDPLDEAFDQDIIMLINAEFMTLHQLGIGPDEGFAITEPDTVWSEYVSDPLLLNSVRTYIGLKVRMIFDPPASSVVADAINNRIAELEFRLNHQAEYEQMEEEHAENQNKEIGGDES